jgi:Fe-S cluster assembly protein SufD
MSNRTVVRKRTKALPKEALEFNFSEADVRAISAELDEPEWLLQRRMEAWNLVQSMSMPSMKDEPWRRTDIRSLPSSTAKLGRVDDVDIDTDLVQPMADNAEEALIIMQPGMDPEIRGHEDLQRLGVTFSPWQEAVKSDADFLQKYMGTVVSDDEGKFAALSTALGRDGIVIHVPRDVELNIPLHSVLWAPGSGMAVFSRVLLVIEDGASVTYIHESASPSKSEGELIHAGILELFIGEGANLKFIEIQNWGRHVWNFTHERAHIEGDGNLDWIFGAAGSYLTKDFSDLVLAGEGAHGRMSGFFFADGEQHLDHDTQQDHLSPNTTSDLLFKGALKDKSRSVWQGMIYVAPGAQNTDGYQANRNLLLSDNARADSIPGLEILADDVRCTHGATIGQLEVEPVYYLMSRGLPRDQAERLVVDGFFSPILERVPFEGVRGRFERMIDQKMSEKV